MMEPIAVAGMQKHRVRLERYMGRSRRLPDSEDVPTFINADGSTNNQPGLQGVACLYDKPFTKDGRLVMFAYGAFGASIYHADVERKVLFDHNDSDIVGTAADGLVFANNTEGLLYRLPLADNPQAGRVKRMIESSRKACASVGCYITDSEIVEIDGQSVQRIIRADLFEVSLVPQGAVDGTTASLVNLRDEEPDLRDAARTLGFKVDKVISNIATSSLRVADGIKRLNEDIADLQANGPTVTMPKRPPSVQQSNAWQTAQTERLQQQARETIGLA
jgi:HK97 family phage prohead protease